MLCSKGAFGSVYKQVLDGTREVAVKQLSDTVGAASIKSFANEVSIMHGCRCAHSPYSGKLAGATLLDAENVHACSLSPCSTSWDRVPYVANYCIASSAAYDVSGICIAVQALGAAC